MYELRRLDSIEHEIICRESICQNNAVFILEKEKNKKIKNIGFYCNFHSILNKEYYEWKSNIVWMNAFVWIPVFWLLIYIPTVKVAKSNLTLKYQSQYNRTSDGGSLEVFNKSKSLKRQITRMGKVLFGWIIVLFVLKSILLAIAFSLELAFFIPMRMYNTSNIMHMWNQSFIIMISFIYIFNWLNFAITILFLKKQTKFYFILFIISTCLCLGWPPAEWIGMGPFGILNLILLLLVILFYIRKNKGVYNQNNLNFSKTTFGWNTAFWILYILNFYALVMCHYIFVSIEVEPNTILFIFYIPATIIFTIIAVLQALMYMSKNKKSYLYLSLLFILIAMAFPIVSIFGVASTLLVCIPFLITTILLIVKEHKRRK